MKRNNHNPTLAEMYPELVKEWAFQRNENETPETIAAHSNKMVWWKCARGHEWETTVNNRTGKNQNGCPFCSGRRVIIGETDLATTNPNLSKEWNNSKNGELTPKEISSGSGKKVWWICDKGHEWEAKVADRAKGNGCPYCSGRFVIKGKSDLQTTNPLLSKEWNNIRNGSLSPGDVSAGSGKKVWWICDKGHEWEASIYSRIKGNGCPYCSGNYVICGETDLATVHPNLVKEWNNIKNGSLSPSEVSSGSGKKVWWICDKGHEWQASISDRSSGKGCPVCSNKKILVGYNDFETTNPDLAKEWNYEKNKGLTPRNVTFGRNKKVWWKCANGHDWLMSVNARSNGGNCPYCSGRYAFAGESDLATLKPQLVREWDYEKNGSLTPESVTCNSGKRVWWKCERGHVWKTTIANRSGGSGCPYCLIKKVCVGYNDLATTNPDLAKEWDYKRNGELTPSDVVASSNKKVWWICLYGHEWEAVINSRSSGCGCPYCSGRNAVMGETDLATIYPELAKEWNYDKNGNLSPYAITSRSSKKVWWKCDKGHEWESTVANRSIWGNGCPYCSNNGSSMPEQGIAFYLSQFCEVKQRIKIRKKEIDVYLPDYRIGIEYDGKYYHQDEAKDEKKTVVLTKAGIALFRIKESDKNAVVDKVVYFKYDNMGPNYEWAIRELFRLLSDYSGNKGFSKISIDVHKDSVEIRKRLSLVHKQNSLADKNPTLAKEWNNPKNGILKPEMFYSNSRQKVWWICKEGHEWEAAIYSRSNGFGCPYCSGRFAIPGKTDLAAKYPQIASEWLYEKNGNMSPGIISANSNKKVWWRCDKGHEWEATVNDRTSRKGCPFCSGRRVVKGETDLATIYPKLAEEWNNEKNGELTPDSVSIKSGKKVWWKCSKGHEWEAAIYSRTGGRGCPFCSGRKHAPILCVEQGKHFSSLAEASKAVGISESAISMCCRGKMKTAGGYHWRYCDSKEN